MLEHFASSGTCGVDSYYSEVMKTTVVTIREAKTNFSRLIEQAASGKEVIYRAWLEARGAACAYCGDQKKTHTGIDEREAGSRAGVL